MAIKTAIIRGLKAVPKSPQLARAIELDNSIERPDLAKERIIDIPTSSFTDLISDKDLPEETEENEKSIEENK